MLNSTKNTIVFTLLYLLTGCSNAFLVEDLNKTSLPVGLSTISISPDWQSADYKLKLPSFNNVEYTITSKPSWLNISPISGTISDSIAVVQCSAEKNTDFSQVGVYTDFMTVKSEGKNHKVPVAYITEGNPTVEYESSIELSYSNYNYLSFGIQNTGLGVLIWDIVSMPDWLAVDTARIDPIGIYIMQNHIYNIPLMFKLGGNFSGNLTGEIVLVTNDKAHPTITINATADLGSPSLNIYTNALNFTSAETSKNLSFSNYGSGILTWKFEDIPDWLTISPSSGMNSPYTSYENIVFSCNRAKLSPGQNTAVIHLKTNDSSHLTYSITVTAVAPGNNENIRAIDGNITDAVFNKNTNTLYYVTSQPNELVAYDVSTRTVLHEISLSKAPTCFAISEDWKKAAVGHNGTFSSIDLSNYTVTNTYLSDYSIHDIAWATNEWYSYTQTGGSFSCLHWINMATGALYDDTDKYSLDGSSIVKKVPGQPYLIATRNSTSPSGFFAYDIATKSKKSYSHMDLTNFWMSEDGQYVFSQNSNIYRTTSSTGSTSTFNTDINAIGKINLGDSNYYGMKFIFHCNHYLWLIRNDSYSSSSSNFVYQFEDNDYTLVKQLACSTLYQPDEQTSAFTLQANYVFANNDGTEVSVLCKGTNNNTWIIQFIPVK